MLVFISHSRENASVALKLCNELGHRQIQTWLDVLNLESGEDWKDKVGKAIRIADALVFVLGPGAESDPGQRFEMQQVVEEEYYLDASKPLIPVLLGSPEIPGFLRVRKAVELNPVAIDFGGLADELVMLLGNPMDTVDRDKLQRGRDARAKALEKLGEYVRDLGIDDVKLAGLRALK